MVKLTGSAIKTEDCKHIILLIVLVALLCSVVYGGFLSGRKFYAYTDVGSDTYNNYWPAYSYFVDVYKTGTFGFWNFEEGLGTSIFTNSDLVFDPFILLFLPFDKTTLPFVLVYAAVLKILLAALFFYIYLSQFSIQPYAKMIGALLYAFNGYMILTGQHYHAATLMVFMPAYLYLYERLALRPTRLVAFMYAVTLAVFLIFCIYYVYFVCLLMPLYILFRWLSSERGTFKDFIIRPALFSCIGAGLGAFLVFPTLYVYLTCPRVSGSLSGANIFSLDSAANYYAVLSRFFSNNAAFSKHLHWYDPALYCGLITLLIVPQIVWHGRIRDRLICGLGFCIVCAALVFPYFRIVMNGFSHTTYRWSFFVILCAIAVGAKALDHLVRTGNVHKKTLAATALVLFSLLAAVILRLNAYGSGRDLLDYGAAGVIIALYCGVFMCMSRAGMMPLLKTLLVLLVAVELAWASYRIVNDRETVSPDSINNRQGYYDYTSDAIAYLRSIDDGFYRVDRSFMSVFLRDSLLHRYMGLQAANSMNHPSYIEFNCAVDVPSLYGTFCYLPGFWSRQNLQTLTGVKYFLAKKGHAVPFGYEYMHTAGDIDIFENRHALPLGFVYDACIDHATFSRLENHQKDEVLLKAFVAEPGTPVPAHVSNVSSEEPTNYLYRKEVPFLPGQFDVAIHGVPEASVDNALPATISIRAFDESPVLDFSTQPISGTPGEAFLNIRMGIECDHAADAVLYWKKPTEEFSSDRSVDVRIKKGWYAYNFGDSVGTLSHFNGAIRLDCSEPHDVRLVIKNVRGNVTVDKLAITARYPRNMLPYVYDTAKLRQGGLKVTTISSDYLQGEIELDSPKLLFLSIPYDEGWKARVNGRRAQTEKVTIGFTGIYLDKGYNLVEMRYVPPWMTAGKIVSIVSIFVLLLVLVFFRKPAQTAAGADYNTHVSSQAL
ncbi:MAG: YfhO family protein [Deltaproteobacteria bacterium]|nr:YfhO family protein [Deltaproteobacteria bacterium]